MLIGQRSDADDRRGEPLKAYVVYRAALLDKLCADHALWVTSLHTFERDASLAATWVNGAGEEQTVAINWAYLAAHRGIIRGVMDDLLACGSLGIQAVNDVFRRQVAVLEEGTFD